MAAVCQHAMQTDSTLFDEAWDGTEQEELDCFVSEVRSQILLCLVDD